MLEKLVSELPTLVPELVSLVKTGKNDEVRGHALSALVTMVTHHREAVKECQREEVRLQSVLVQLSQSLSAEDHEVLERVTQHNSSYLRKNGRSYVWLSMEGVLDLRNGAVSEKPHNFLTFVCDNIFS